MEGAALIFLIENSGDGDRAKSRGGSSRIGPVFGKTAPYQSGLFLSFRGLFLAGPQNCAFFLLISKDVPRLKRRKGRNGSIFFPSPFRRF